MKFEEAREYILHNRELIKTHTFNLMTYEQQAAAFGDLYVPPHIKSQIVELKEKIEILNANIHDTKIQVVEKLVGDMNKLHAEGANYIALIELYKQYLQDTEAKAVSLQMILPDALIKYGLSINHDIVYDETTGKNIFREMDTYIRNVIRDLEDIFSQIQKQMSDIGAKVSELSIM